MQMTCGHCGTQYHVPPSRVKRGGGKFCGKECYAAHQRENPHTVRGKVAIPAFITQCQNCGKDFKTQGGRPRRYCSHACSTAGKSVTKTCATCGKEFTVPKSNDARYTNCSSDCRYPDVRYVPCKRCGKVFRSGNAGNAHCSEECRRPPVLITCLACGKEFRVVPANRARFCSVRCYRVHTGETEPEARVRQALEQLGHKFIQEAVMPQWRWPVDFFLPEHGIVLEVDGVYWHSKTTTRDARKDAHMQSLGHVVIRLEDTPFYGDLTDDMVSAVATAVNLAIGAPHAKTTAGMHAIQLSLPIA